MSIDPSQIHLTPDQQAFIARQSALTGMPWRELLDQFVPTTISRSPDAESALDMAYRLGLMGACDGDPPDLASNPDHLDGFGRHG